MTGKDSTLDVLPDEVLINIFSYLYAMELVAIQSTNRRFRQFIKDFFFAYPFNQGYTEKINDYKKNYWASVVKRLDVLQSGHNMVTYIQSALYYTTPEEDARHTAVRIQLSTIRNGVRSFLPQSKFQECFQQFHVLLRPDILSYIILNMNNEFFNVVMNMAMSQRATDGLYSRLKNGHYSFDNFFSYFVAQVIFVLLDGIIPLEKKLRQEESSNSILSANITRESYSVIYKQASIYAVRTPRYKIFQATSEIDYNAFFNKLNQPKKKRLTQLLVTAQMYIDVCRKCEGLRDPPSFDVFVNQSFTVMKRHTSSLYFELADKVRIVSSGEENETVFFAEDVEDSDRI